VVIHEWINPQTSNVIFEKRQRLLSKLGMCLINPQTYMSWPIVKLSHLIQT